jgi:hypothetical protein
MGDRVTVEELLDVAEELAFQPEEQTKFWKIGDTRGLRVYVKRAHYATEVHFAGFTLECDEVTAVSEAEARAEKIGNVRGKIEPSAFERLPRERLLQLFRRGLDELVENAHLILRRSRQTPTKAPIPVEAEPLSIDARLFTFKGYGRADAPIWFLGIEEGFGGRLSNPGWTVQRELDARAGWKEIEDAAEAGRTLEDHYWERRNYSRVWRNAAKLARALVDNASDWSDTNVAHEYVVEKLGRFGGDTFLGELFPLPAIGLEHWPYGGRWSDRDEYREELWDDRRTQWQRLLAASSPKLIICYGTDVRSYACELFGCQEQRGVYVHTAAARIVFAPFIGGRTSRALLQEIVDAARG